MFGELNKWAVCSCRGMGHSKRCVDCCKANIVHVWFFLQAPDFPLKITGGIGINFHEAKTVLCVCVCVAWSPGD